MSANLSNLGLVPAGHHPDAELFAMIAKRDAQHDEWNAAQGEEAHRRILAKWRRDCPVDLEEAIARTVPATLEGLVEKADNALRSWREAGDTRYCRIHATMATALEQALQILKAQPAVQMPAADLGAA